MSRRPKPVRHTAKRLYPGRYEYRGRSIVRTTWEGEGVRGGTHVLWEIGEADEQGVVTLDGLNSASTLRAARRLVDDLVGAEK